MGLKPGEITHKSGCILLVEDDALVRETIGARLSRLGFAVIVAENADIAIGILNTTPGIDLVLSDVSMPGTLNGADLAREVQQRWPAIRILLTTGYAESSLAKIKLPIGIELLAKPYTNATFDQLIRTTIPA
jgi:CheY-like chemotaxis protein